MLMYPMVDDICCYQPFIDIYRCEKKKINGRQIEQREKNPFRVPNFNNNNDNMGFEINWLTRNYILEQRRHLIYSEQTWTDK